MLGGDSDFYCRPCADARLWTKEKDLMLLFFVLFSFILSYFSETHEIKTLMCCSYCWCQTGYDQELKENKHFCCFSKGAILLLMIQIVYFQL